MGLSLIEFYDLYKLDHGGTIVFGFGPDLIGSQLEGACLAYVDLPNISLKNVNLKNADLMFANLGGVDLEGANLDGARLFHTYLGGAKLDYASFRGAYYSSKTIWPSGFWPQVESHLVLDDYGPKSDPDSITDYHNHPTEWYPKKQIDWHK